MEKNTKYLIISLLFISMLLVGCDDKPTPPKQEGGNEQDTNILRTDEFGNILGGDSTDWCFKIGPWPRFGPAYPNPCIGPQFTIEYTTFEPDTIKIYFLKPNNDSIVVFIGAAQAGSNSYNIDVSGYNFTNTFQRLYIQAQNFSSSDSCKNYGDIKFEP